MIEFLDSTHAISNLRLPDSNENKEGMKTYTFKEIEEALVKLSSHFCFRHRLIIQVLKAVRFTFIVKFSASLVFGNCYVWSVG